MTSLFKVKVDRMDYSLSLEMAKILNLENRAAMFK